MKKGKVKKLMSITLTAAMIGTSYIPAYAEES